MPVPELLLQRRKEMLLLKLSRRRFRQVNRLVPPILQATNRRAIGLWPQLATRPMMQPDMSWGTYNAQSAALWKGLTLMLPRRLRLMLWKNRKTRRDRPPRPGKRRMHSHSKPGLHKRKRKG